jgi:hypothetical protein
MVYGGSLAGLGAPSAPSKAFHCDAWTMPEPGTAPKTSLKQVDNLKMKQRVHSSKKQMPFYMQILLHI